MTFHPVFVRSRHGHSQESSQKTRGAVAVETSLILITLFMFIFGIFEYSRLLMDWNLLNNAAREGCRYAGQ